MIKVASIFAQVLSLINRREFSRSVAELQAEKRAKGFRCWEQLTCMLISKLKREHLKTVRNGTLRPLVAIRLTSAIPSSY